MVGNPTRAEAPLGERSTTCATPFQSLSTSSPDLGSVELAKRPMLIDNRRGTKQAALGARRAEQHTRAAGERPTSGGAGLQPLLLMPKRVVVVLRSPWCRQWGRFGCYGQAARGGGRAARARALSV